MVPKYKININYVFLYLFIMYFSSLLWQLGGVFVYFTVTRVSTIPISAEVHYWLLWSWDFVGFFVCLGWAFFVVVVLGGVFSVLFWFGWLVVFFKDKLLQSCFAIHL